MELGINYEQAKKLLDKYVTDNITKLHLIETEAIMRTLAKHFKEDEDESAVAPTNAKALADKEAMADKWGIIGLLHDIDWELTKDNPKEHCVKAVDILRQAGASDFLIESVISHGYAHESIPAYLDKQRKGKLQHSLAAAETLTGLIIAAALVQPDKKLVSVKLNSLKKKFKQKAFAANCDREIIRECEKAGINLDEFLNIGLKALQNISDKIGL